MPAGRPPTPTSKLKLHGGYRKERHAGRDKEPVATGEPVQVIPLGDDGKALWDFVVPKLIASKVARSIDSPALTAMCFWWDEWRKADSIEVARYRRLALRDTFAMWQSLASRFGLTPSDRTKLQADVPAKDDLEAMLA